MMNIQRRTTVYLNVAACQVAKTYTRCDQTVPQVHGDDSVHTRLHMTNIQRRRATNEENDGGK